MPAYKRKDQWSETWHYRKQFKLPDGRTVNIAGTPAINTKRAAEDAERAHVERTINPPKPVVERRLVGDVFDRFLEDYVAVKNNKSSEVASKKSAIERHLKPELGKLYLDQVTEERIAALSAKLARTDLVGREGKLSAKSRKNILQTLRKCLRWAAKTMKWIEIAPEIDMPKVDNLEMRFLSDAELASLLETTASEPLWYAAIVLAADAGLRLGELRALRWTDYNQVTNHLVISRSRWRNEESSPKSRKPRSVAVSKRLAEAFKAIKETRLRGPYVLSRAGGEPFGAEWMNETIERLTRNAKITDCTWHTLRHTFCTRLALLGATPGVIQKAAGHASLATTMRYMHVVQGDVDGAIALLDGHAARSLHGTKPAEGASDEAGVIVQFPSSK